MPGRLQQPLERVRFLTQLPAVIGYVVLVAGLLAWSPAARAQTDEIQVYDAEITAPEKFNLTWHNNYTPSGRTQPAISGGVVPNHALNGVPEWAYGVTDWFEAGSRLRLAERAAYYVAGAPHYAALPMQLGASALR
jgi:hypothetical protein